MNYKYPPRNTISITDIVEAYNIVRNRTFNKEETQKLTLLGYVLTGVILGETVGNPGDKSVLFSQDGMFSSPEFNKLKTEIDSYNIIQQRFGGETDDQIDAHTKLLNTTLKDISEKLSIIDNEK